MRGGNKRVAGTEAGPKNSHAVFALRLQPVHASANINYGLAGRVNGAADVWRDRIVRALRLPRTANVMIWLAQPPHGDPEALQPRAPRIVSDAGGVPVRQHNYPPLSLPRKPPRVDHIVFRIGGGSGRGKTQKIPSA